MKRSRLGRSLGLALGVVACAAALCASAAAGSGQGRIYIAGTKPSWTAAAHQTTSLPAGQVVSAKVWLAARNKAQLDSLAQAVSDPSSARYGQFVTPAQYDAQFAPTAGQLSAVTQWLTDAGLQIGEVGPDNQYVTVTGTAGAIKSAFAAQLGTYAVTGKQVQAPTTTLSVPASLGSTVLAVTGLTKFGHRVRPADYGPPAGFVNAPPCSSYYGQRSASDQPRFHGRTLPYAICGYTPSQLRGAYGEDSQGSASSLGKGATVAITDAFDADTLEQDTNTYSARHGENGFARHQFQDRSFPEPPASDPRVDDCGGNDWYGEQALDVEAVHGMAPAANVLYYGAASCYDDDLLASLTKVVHDNDASIVTNSWGEATFVVDPTIGCNPCSTIDQDLVNAYETVFEHGAVQGIGFYFSSGDDGDELDAAGYKHPDYPAGDPWATAVGGTSLAVDRNNRRSFETGWGTQRYDLSESGNSWEQSIPFLYGSGGGFSEVFSEPWYQRGVVGRDPTGGRAVPDIGLDGDPTTGMLVGETQSFDVPTKFGPAGNRYGEYRIGGTSLSSPLYAGLNAVAEGRSRIGFANPFIYGLASRGVYYDVLPEGDLGNIRGDYVNGENAADGVVFSLRTFDQDSSLRTDRAWDDVTGVGAPTARYFDQFRGRH